MVTQVITFKPDGTISGLQVKKGRGLDLRSFGRADIIRASLIEWDTEAQAWVVTVQDAPGLDVLKGVTLTYRMASKAGIDAVVSAMLRSGKVVTMDGVDENAPILFEEYDDAVAVEIAFLDAHRVAGRC